MCNQNSCFGGNSCCWIIIAIILLFLFCGTKTDRIKGLIFEGDGYLLVYKRLSAGRFRWPRTQEEAMAITQEQFDLLMQGMTIVSTIRQVNPKRLC